MERRLFGFLECAEIECASCIGIFFCARDAEGAKRLPSGNGAAQDGEPCSQPGFLRKQKMRPNELFAGLL